MCRTSLNINQPLIAHRWQAEHHQFRQIWESLEYYRVLGNPFQLQASSRRFSYYWTFYWHPMKPCGTVCHLEPSSGQGHVGWSSHWRFGRGVWRCLSSCSIWLTPFLAGRLRSWLRCLPTSSWPWRVKQSASGQCRGCQSFQLWSHFRSCWRRWTRAPSSSSRKMLGPWSWRRNLLDRLSFRPSS